QGLSAEAPMPEYSAILYDVRDSVATITLNRPDAANSANETLSTQLLDAVIRSEEDSAIRFSADGEGTILLCWSRTEELLCHVQRAQIADILPSCGHFAHCASAVSSDRCD